MNDDAMVILSALVDGDPVPPDALADALLAPGAREALVDFARLRAEVGADESRPSTAFYSAIHQGLGTRPRPRRTVWRALQGVAAAVVLALAAVGAMSLPERFAAGGDQPPRATRVLPFTPGVDWHEGGLR